MAAHAPARDARDIPAEFIWDKSFDAFTAEGDDPWLAAARLHDMPPVVWTSDAAFGRPGWIATRYETVSEGFTDFAHFSAERPGMIADMLGEPVRLNPIEIDPPAHHGYRRNLNPLFTPRAIGALIDAVRDTCSFLIDQFADRAGCEFVHDFAIRFPTHVFLDLMALPRDKAELFMQWEDDVMRGAGAMIRVKAAREIYATLCAHKEAQKVNPSNGLNHAIVTGTFGERPLDHYEMMGMYYVLWAGGLDTVYSTLGWIMQHLAKHPELQDELRADPDLLDGAVEEFARAFSVVCTHRSVAGDYTFHGAPLKQGDELHLPIMLANRDPAVFADPHTIDIRRRPRHIAFGTGAHACLGIHLAKRELRMVIEQFLARFRNIRIRPGEVPRHHTGRTFGMDYLPLVWDRV